MTNSLAPTGHSLHLTAAVWAAGGVNVNVQQGIEVILPGRAKQSPALYKGAKPRGTEGIPYLLWQVLILRANLT